MQDEIIKACLQPYSHKANFLFSLFLVWLLNKFCLKSSFSFYVTVLCKYCAQLRYLTILFCLRINTCLLLLAPRCLPEM